MKCEAGGNCKRAAPCEHACDLRIQTAYTHGREDCLIDWARHMRGMAQALAIKPAPAGRLDPDEEREFREWLKGVDSRDVTARNAWAARALLAKLRGES